MPTNVRSDRSVWVTGRVTARSRRALSLTAVDRNDRERTCTLPLVHKRGQRGDGATVELLVPEWWAYSCKLPYITEESLINQDFSKLEQRVLAHGAQEYSPGPGTGRTPREPTIQELTEQLQRRFVR